MTPRTTTSVDGSARRPRRVGSSLWRWAVRRLLLPLVLMLTLAPEFAGRARAIETWCADDPVVSVNGRLLDIQVQMPLDNVLTMRSTTLTVIIPNNLSGSVVVDDVSAFPMRTTVSSTGPAWSGEGAVPITIQARVAAPSDFPVRVVATPLLNLTTPLAGSTTAYGTANALLTIALGIG